MSNVPEVMNAKGMMHGSNETMMIKYVCVYKPGKTLKSGH